MGDKKLLDFTCPECRGPMHTFLDDGPPTYQCKVGHAYSMRALLMEHSSTEERQLWSAALALEEAASVAVEAIGVLPELGEQLTAAARAKERQAEAIKKLIEELKPFPVE